ncbi:extracellular superoxide dismutase [Cu-Zn] [Tamandua tetradactyla]|uniref:extracellular superoxide dismutase [Cu-Zn] n=1 Tax=Tamandua tetradactyla TaxID=48850 RepID=UPI0040538CFB
MTFFRPAADHSPGLAFLHSHPPNLLVAAGVPAAGGVLLPILSERKAALEALERGARRCPAATMLALLFSCLLLAARASRASADSDEAELSFSTAELIRDVHVMVTEIWQELPQRRAADRGADPALYASCQVRPSAALGAAQPRVSGQVLFRQLAPDVKLEAYFDLEGFPVEANGSSRAIHVHHFGDLSEGCGSTGPHYNPLGVPHPRHPGDFGNFGVRNGRLWKYRSGLGASLAGPYSIVGRAVVVHAGEDDLGRGGNQASLENGNAGSRLACCVVGLSGPAPWARQAQEHTKRKKRRRESEKKAT